MTPFRYVPYVACVALNGNPALACVRVCVYVCVYFDKLFGLGLFQTSVQ